jgi:hypothetical protein
MKRRSRKEIVGEVPKRVVTGRSQKRQYDLKGRKEMKVF